MTGSRKKTRAQHENAFKARAVKTRKKKELKAAKALKSFFYDTHGDLRRKILTKGYLILSYLTPYNHILQSYFILVHHHL